MDFLPSGAKRERYRAPEAICSNYKNSLTVAKKSWRGRFTGDKQGRGIFCQSLKLIFDTSLSQNKGLMIL